MGESLCTFPELKAEVKAFSFVRKRQARNRAPILSLEANVILQRICKYLRSSGIKDDAVENLFGYGVRIGYFLHATGLHGRRTSVLYRYVHIIQVRVVEGK